MIAFPCLEVVALPWTGRGLAQLPEVGARLALTERFELGRSKAAQVVVPLQSVARNHTRIEHRHGRWWALDLGSPNGTFVNGARVKDAELTHGDLLELPWGLTFRVLLHDPDGDTNARVEQELLDFPDDEHRWDVWADWLLERGLPLGRRLRGEAGSIDDDSRALGAMAVQFRAGVVEAQFRRGFPVRVVVRDPDGRVGVVGGVGALLDRLLQEPAFRFVRTLEIDPLSFAPLDQPADGGAELDEVLGVLASAAGPRWLERLRLGPLPAATLSAGQREAFDAVRARHPQLATTADQVLVMARHASLEVVSVDPRVDTRPGVGRSVGLTTEEPNVIAQVEDAAIRIDADAVVQLSFQNGRWLLDDLRAGKTSSVRVNGRATFHAVLRDGDLIEFLEGLSVRFRMR